jgi:integrase
VSGSMRLVRGKDMWELRVYLGRDDAGRVRHRHARFRGTKREAERALARMVAEMDSQRSKALQGGAPCWGDRTTVNDAIAGWQANGWDDLSPSTTRRYESIWATHIRDSIGPKRIAGLNPYDVEKYFRQLKSQGLAEASVRQVRALLHRACRLAKKWSGGVLPNPVSDTELPAWSFDERNDVRAPDPSEVRTLIAVAMKKDVRLGAFLRLLAATGMRRGEACALRWSDVDFESGTVTVDESVSAAKGGALVKGPKTRASVRTVACDPGTLRVLADLLAEQRGLASTCGHEVCPDSFVFSFEPGGERPPYPDSFSHAMTRLRQKAGVKADVHLHSLRHFHATVLDPVISEAQKQARLGWSTVQMARHYTDGVAAEDRRAAKHVGELLGSEA